MIAIPCKTPVSLVRNFAYQSFFDDTLQANALAVQDPGAPIVASASDQQSISGYGVSLHPSSQAPVGVIFNYEVSGNSQPHIVVPGESLIISRTTPFIGLTYGIPFGWLGGGLVRLLVYQHPETVVKFADVRPEVILQRQRMKIVNDALVGGLTTAYNWPNKFPWTNAIRVTGGVNFSQAGGASLHSIPTRTEFRLRVPNLAAAATMRIVWTRTDTFDLGGATGTTLDTSSTTYYDYTWPANVNGSGGAATSQVYSTFALSGNDQPYGGDNCAVFLLDMSGTGALTNAQVDITRYGRL
jgi:hypothetical protein